MHYRHNYLKTVIFRLDFDAIPAVMQHMRVDVRPGFSGRLAETFPVVTGQPTATLAVNVGPTGAGLQQQITGVAWRHKRTEEGTQTVTLTHDSLVLEYGKNDFDHFPPFRAHAEIAVAALIAEYNLPQVNRLGLRYINEINLPEGNPLDWDGLLQPNLIIAAKAGSLEGTQIVRSMHQITLRRADHTTVFNYGILNPDFPNALARRVFILDYDCSRRGPTPAGEIMPSLNEANLICEAMFENSIANDLRNIMEIVND